jgi:uncharacterized protein (DUF433 family)
MTPDDVDRYIEVNSGNGRKSVFWATKITPEHIIDDFAKGMTPAEILSEHPQLTLEHLEAAVVYRSTFPTDGDKLLIAAAWFALPSC